MNVELPEKRYYSIGEVSKAFDVNASLIRFWEKEFSALKPKKSSRGKRLFTDKDIETLRSIYLLVKQEGYTLEGAKKQLNQYKKDSHRNSQLINRLQKIQAQLKEIRDQL